MPAANLAVLLIGGVLLLGVGPTGALWITTLPTGADVWLDGAYVGRSPVVVDALAAGEHKMTLTLTGWEPQDVSASVVAGQTSTTAVVLMRDSVRPLGRTGTLALAGQRPESVAVDGLPATWAKDGTLSLTAGTHELAFVDSQGKTTETVTVYPEMRTEIVLTSETPARSPVIAPADDYLPAGSFRIDGSQLLVHYGGHDVVARVGSTDYRIDNHSAAYDSAPTIINGRLYLPLELLTLLNPNPVPKK